MFKVIPFKKEHMIPLLDQDINKVHKAGFMSGKMDELEKIHSFTMIYDETILVCYGVIEIWKKRGQLWTVFNQESKFHFVPIIRAAKRLFLESEFDRIEMAVPVPFETGHRRARLLGCTMETRNAPKYFPNGEACSLYAWIRG